MSLSVIPAKQTACPNRYRRAGMAEEVYIILLDVLSFIQPALCLRRPASLSRGLQNWNPLEREVGHVYEQSLLEGH